MTPAKDRDIGGVVETLARAETLVRAETLAGGWFYAEGVG